MKKRLWSILLTLALLLSFAPALGGGAKAAAKMPTKLFIGTPKNGSYYYCDIYTKGVATSGGGKATYDQASNTLTLADYSFTEVNCYWVEEQDYALYCDGDLTILLSGTNVLSQQETDPSKNQHGIYVEGNLTIRNVQGKSATLAAEPQTAAEHRSQAETSTGIFCAGKLTIEQDGGSLAVTAAGGTVEGSDSKSYGVYARGGVEVKGGSLTARGYTKAIVKDSGSVVAPNYQGGASYDGANAASASSYAANWKYARLSVTRLRIAGYDGELTPGGQDSSCPYSFEPVDGKSVLTLNNSESNAAKGEMYQFAPDKFASIWASGDLTINIPGSKYDMAINTVTEASSLNPNYYCIYVDGDLTIRGGSDANPKFTMVTSGKNRIWMECAAIYCTGRLTIDCAGTVIAAGTSDVYLHSYGAYAGKGVTVRAGTLTAQSGAICRKGDETGVNGESCAVRSGGGVIVESGALDALGAQTDKGLVNCSSCGVYAGGDVEVKSGTLTARGGGYATYAANNSIGVRAKSVTVRDSGALEATGRLADNESCGILVSGSIRGEGTGTILAKAGETAAVSYGIEYVGDYPDSAMTIALYEGGVLTAQGKTAAIKNSKNDRFTFSVESCRGSESYDGADAAEANEFVPGWRYAVLDGHLSMSVAITEGESMTKLAGDRSFTLHATVTGTSGGTWTWSSSDTSVASVSNAGEVCIRKAGRATITARYVDSSNVGTASLALTVLGTMQKPVVTVSGTKLHWSAQLPDTGKRAMVIAAWYDADGRLLGCGADTLTASGAADGDLTVGAGAAAYRLMIVDATSFAPLCAAAGA